MSQGLQGFQDFQQCLLFSLVESTDLERSQWRQDSEAWTPRGLQGDSKQTPRGLFGPWRDQKTRQRNHVRPAAEETLPACENAVQTLHVTFISLPAYWMLCLEGTKFAASASCLAYIQHPNRPSIIENAIKPTNWVKIIACQDFRQRTIEEIGSIIDYKNQPPLFELSRQNPKKTRSYGSFNAGRHHSLSSLSLSLSCSYHIYIYYVKCHYDFYRMSSNWRSVRYCNLKRCGMM